MPITKKSSNIEKFVQNKVDNLIEDMIDIFDAEGLNAVREMRTRRRYTDRTNNLRSSTGYAVVFNGNVVRGGKIEPVTDGNPSGGNGADGVQKGEAAINEIASESTTNSISLILVAGEYYAHYVERMGLNVMDSARRQASDGVESMMAQLGLIKKK